MGVQTFAVAVPMPQHAAGRNSALPETWHCLELGRSGAAILLQNLDAYALRATTIASQVSKSTQLQSESNRPCDGELSQSEYSQGHTAARRQSPSRPSHCRPHVARSAVTGGPLPSRHIGLVIDRVQRPSLTPWARFICIFPTALQADWNRPGELVMMQPNSDEMALLMRGIDKAVPRMQQAKIVPEEHVSFFQPNGETVLLSEHLDHIEGFNLFVAQPGNPARSGRRHRPEQGPPRECKDDPRIREME